MFFISNSILNMNVWETAYFRKKNFLKWQSEFRVYASEAEFWQIIWQRTKSKENNEKHHLLNQLCVYHKHNNIPMIFTFFSRLEDIYRLASIPSTLKKKRKHFWNVISLLTCTKVINHTIILAGMKKFVWAPWNLPFSSDVLSILTVPRV